MKSVRLAIGFLMGSLCAAGTVWAQSSTAPAAALPDAPSATAHEAPPAVPTGPTVVMDTSMGRLTCKLFDKEAPVAAANFVGLATGTKAWTDPVTQQKVTGKPFYDGTTFHRVIPGFMIQGGDRVGNGTGDAGYFFDNEISPALRFDVAGRLAMANSGPNTNGTQFFITEAPQPDLNGQYTIFGQCDQHSTLIAASIARVERDPRDKPVVPVVINKVTVVLEGGAMPPVPAAPAGQTAAPTASGTTAAPSGTSAAPASSPAPAAVARPATSQH